MDVLGRRLAAEYPDDYRGSEGEFALGTGMTVIASNDVRIHPQADAPIMAIASLVLVVVGLVLAIACSNLATLLLVRGAARAKEIVGAAGRRRHAASARAASARPKACCSRWRAASPAACWRGGACRR